MKAKRYICLGNRTNTPLAILRFDVILQFSNTIGQSKDNFFQLSIFFGGKITSPCFMTFLPIG